MGADKRSAARRAKLRSKTAHRRLSVPEVLVDPRGARQVPPITSELDNFVTDRPLEPTAIHQSSTGTVYHPVPAHAMVTDVARPEPNPRHPMVMQWVVRNWHRIWPGAATLAWMGFNARDATVSGHDVFGGFEIAIGMIAAGFAALTHHAHGEDADTHFTRIMGGFGVALVAGGVASEFGGNPYTDTMTLVVGAGAYMGRILWDNHRLTTHQAYHVQLTEAANGGPAQLWDNGEQPALQPGAAGTLAEQIVAAFRDAGFPGVVLDGAPEYHEHGFTVVVIMPSGKNTTYEDARRRLVQIAANLGVRRVALEATKWPHKVRLNAFTLEHDPTEDIIPWPGPKTTDITKPIPIGINSVGTVVYITLYELHTLYGGQTRKGKSGGINALVCSLAAIENAVMVLFDLKYGQVELGPYKNVAYQTARGIKGASRLMHAFNVAMHARGVKLAKLRDKLDKPVRKWDPNNPEHGPQIVIVIDELAQLFRLDKKIFKPFLELMQVSGALGFTVVAASQEFSAQSSGGTTAAVSQFLNVIGFRMRDATHVNTVFGQGASKEWNTSNLPLQGMFLIRSPDYEKPDPCRGYWVEADDVMDHVRPYIGKRPALDALTACVMERILAGANPDQVHAVIDQLDDQFADVDAFVNALITAMGGVVPTGSGPDDGPGGGGGDGEADADEVLDMLAVVDTASGRHLRAVPSVRFPDGVAVPPGPETELWNAIKALKGRQYITVSSLAGQAMRWTAPRKDTWIRSTVSRWVAAGYLQGGNLTGEWRVCAVPDDEFEARASRKDA